MKFGPVPVAQALGATLAHSVGLSTGAGRLRKGLVLEAAHLQQLSDAGIGAVVVARLESGDMDENRAAERLAAALVPDPDAAGLQIAAPFTGRVNIQARKPGVLQLETARITAANTVDPMITIATLPDLTQIAAGTMVATVKIISYAVPERAVQQACAALGAGGAMTATPVRHRTTSLIVTDLPGGPGDKGARAIRSRVQALGMSQVEQIVVDHDTGTLAQAIRAAKGDIILILTASATSDPDDVGPGALRAAGGAVERFGMPVDPGNLLFLGARADGTPVIGLPGCARSPALNGADWVLSRVACGIAVQADDIAAMGVGGLLKESPARGMPRKGRG